MHFVRYVSATVSVPPAPIDSIVVTTSRVISEVSIVGSKFAGSVQAAIPATPSYAVASEVENPVQRHDRSALNVRRIRDRGHGVYARSGSLALGGQPTCRFPCVGLSSR